MKWGGEGGEVGLEMGIWGVKGGSGGRGEDGGPGKGKGWDRKLKLK